MGESFFPIKIHYTDSTDNPNIISKPEDLPIGMGFTILETKVSIIPPKPKPKTYTKQELDKILSDHKLWIEGKPEGKRADLSKADLSEANLSEANLSGANLSGANLYGACLFDTQF